MNLQKKLFHSCTISSFSEEFSGTYDRFWQVFSKLLALLHRFLFWGSNRSIHSRNAVWWCTKHGPSVSKLKRHIPYRCQLWDYDDTVRLEICNYLGRVRTSLFLCGLLYLLFVLYLLWQIDKPISFLCIFEDKNCCYDLYIKRRKYA